MCFRVCNNSRSEGARKLLLVHNRKYDLDFFQLLPRRPSVQLMVFIDRREVGRVCACERLLTVVFAVMSVFTEVCTARRGEVGPE